MVPKAPRSQAIREGLLEAELRAGFISGMHMAMHANPN
jgi:hypothetical protein